MYEQQERILLSSRVLKSLALTLLLGLGLSALLFGSMSVAAQAQDLRAPGNPMPFPEPNSHTVPQTASVGISYDEPIDPATVNTRTFAVHAMQSGQLLGVYGVDSNVIYLTPTRPFYPGELVMASATTGTLSDIDGDAPLTPTVWTFRAEVTEGSGIFVDSGQRLGTDLLGRDVELGDLDGDGDLDAFTVNRASRPAKIWLNDGAGIFVDSGQALATGNGSGLALGDIDGDGDLDAVVADSSQSVVWQNDGAAVFTSTQVISGSMNLSLGDLDGDADLDLFLARPNENVVWVNNGGLQGGTEGSFSDSGQLLGFSSGWWDVDLADLDEDGDLDAFVANYGGGNRVWLNDGAAMFTDSGQSLGSSFSTSVALGDLNNDGLPDAFVANTNVQSNEIWFNLGGGVFTPTVQTVGDSSTYDIALGDVDADGDLDSFWANIKGQPSELWLNNGGVFTDSGQYFGGTFESYSVALGDVNGDGDLDAFMANEPVPSYVWLNNQPPSLENVALDALDYNEGDKATLTGDINDADPQDAFTLKVTWGDGFTNTYYYPAGTTTFTETHLYVDDDPSGTPADVYDVAMVLYDGDGSSDSIEMETTVHNVAPIVDNVSLDATVDENDTATLVAAFTDPGLLDTYDAVILWGDGEQDNFAFTAGVRAFTQTHQYLDDDPLSGTPFDTLTATIILVDDDTGEAITFTNIIAYNVPPVVNAGPDLSGVDGQPISFTGAFTDVGTLDTHTIVWDFGDGITATGSLTPTHTYAEANVYLVTLTITDDDTGVGTDTTVVTVEESIEVYYLPIVHNAPDGMAARTTPWLAWGGALLALPVAGIIWMGQRRQED